MRNSLPNDHEPVTVILIGCDTHFRLLQVLPVASFQKPTLMGYIFHSSSSHTSTYKPHFVGPAGPLCGLIKHLSTLWPYTIICAWIAEIRGHSLHKILKTLLVGPWRCNWFFIMVPPFKSPPGFVTQRHEKSIDESWLQGNCLPLWTFCKTAYPWLVSLYNAIIH